MPSYKVVPFSAQISRQDTTATVAAQMQTIIDSHTAEGWEYKHTDTVQTSVAGTNGCFGLGAEPAFNTTYNVLVFSK